MKRALITGITGMDGSYLAEFLLEKDYKVFGMERRTSTKNWVNTSHLENKITFHENTSEIITLNDNFFEKMWSRLKVKSYFHNIEYL